MTVDDDGAPIETDDSWKLPLVRGGVIHQLRFDFGFTIVVDQRISVRLEQTFDLSRDGDTTTYNCDDLTTFGPLLTLHQAVVEKLVEYKSGALSFEFQDGSQLNPPPSTNEHEAFTIDGITRHSGRAFEFVSTPGGGLATWFKDS